MTSFRQLNHGWNAEPNCPNPRVEVQGDDVLLSFEMNHFVFTDFKEGDVGVLRFSRCNRYRLGSTNDEGWYRGQCRFSRVAPGWGEFYEVVGDLRLDQCPNDWVRIADREESQRHFLFYLRDETFECNAEDWTITVRRAG